MREKIVLGLVMMLFLSMFFISFSFGVNAISEENDLILWNKLEQGINSEIGPDGWSKYGSPAELHDAGVFNDGSLFQGIQRVGFTLWGDQIEGVTPKWGQDELTIEFWAKPDIERISNSYGGRYYFTLHKGCENPNGFIRLKQNYEYLSMSEGVLENSLDSYEMSSDVFTHIAISINTNVVELYINNDLVFTGILKTEVIGTYMPYEFLLGGGWQYNDWDWSGIIDNVKVYNYAKTDFSNRFSEDGSEPNKAPNADFEWNANNLIVSFIDNSCDTDGTIISRIWDFGDGTSCIEENPIHTYINPGVYTVELIVTDNEDVSDNICKEIEVSAPEEPELVDATIDIDPNTLNKKSKGNWITCYIELPIGYDVSDINISTILLNEQIHAEESPTEIGDNDNDGISDLMVKFDRASVINILEVGNNIIINITGKLDNETQFEGYDTIKVKDKGNNIQSNSNVETSSGCNNVDNSITQQILIDEDEEEDDEESELFEVEEDIIEDEVEEDIIEENNGNNIEKIQDETCKNHQRNKFVKTIQDFKTMKKFSFIKYMLNNILSRMEINLEL